MTLLFLACADADHLVDNGPREAARYSVSRPLETTPGRDLSIGIATISSSATFSESGATAGDALGSSLAAGDFDGDGTPEVAVGAPGYDDSGSDDGAVYLLSGSALALDQVGTGGLGAALASGDIDADLDDDLVAANESTVYLYTGDASGLGLASWSYTDGDASVASTLALADLDGNGSDEIYVGASSYNSGAGRVSAFATLDATPSSTVDGNSGEALGAALSRASDADGDGYEELLIGSESYSGSYSAEGAVYVYGGGSFTLSQTVTGGSADFGLGVHVADGGDSNGDGYGDLWVAAHFVSGSGDHKGRVLLYEGSATGYESAPQMNRTGGSDDALGYNGIAGGVDIDFDGYDDLLAAIADLPGLVVYYGAASGVSSSNANNVSLASTTGASDSLGVATAAPDLDGDGYGEFIVGDRGNYSTGSSGDAYGWVGVFEGYADRDGDGYSGGATGGDCDDADASVNPVATEVVGDGIDNDCNGFESCYQDADGDAYGSTTTVASADADCDDAGESNNADDCDDARADANPAGTEVEGDGVDNDCDGVEGCFLDLDLDGYGSTTAVASADGDCDDAGEAINDDDCDDGDDTVYPGATETNADGIDSDCDGYERCHQDADGDGAGDGATTDSTDLSCTSAGLATSPNDCDDTDASISPSAAEVTADGIDQDCNGIEDCYVDNDGDRYGYTGTIGSTDTDCDDTSEAGNDDDCDDTSASVYPGAGETPGDGVDGNCDGVEDCFTDGDGDGFGGGSSAPGNDLDCADAGEASSGDDCDDSEASRSPGAMESCNDLDDDCDDEVDENATDAGSWYADDDQDAHGDPGLSVTACDQPEGYVADATDCDDQDEAAFPGAVEDCEGTADRDCDGEPAATDDDCPGDSGEPGDSGDSGEPDDSGEPIDSAEPTDSGDPADTAEPGTDDTGDKGDSEDCGCNGGAGAGGVAMLLALATTTRRRKS